ncbi:unnamed protein product, partial [Didymodactylos carnosus]
MSQKQEDILVEGVNSSSCQSENNRAQQETTTKYSRIIKSRSNSDNNQNSLKRTSSNISRHNSSYWSAPTSDKKARTGDIIELDDNFESNRYNEDSDIPNINYNENTFKQQISIETNDHTKNKQKPMQVSQQSLDFAAEN